MFSDSMMLGGGRKAAFSIANSVRLDGVADYFTRTPAVVGNQKTWTFSVWFKPANLGNSNPLLGVSNNGTTYAQISFDGTTGHLSVLGVVSASTEYFIVTTAQFRDPTAWYHVLVAVDTTQATAANRMKVYINGGQITSFSSTIYPALNSDTLINSTIEHRVGWLATPTSYRLDGYLASPILIDGAALDPTSFGETDPVTGSWRPKAFVPVLEKTCQGLTAKHALATLSANASRVLISNVSGNQYWQTGVSEPLATSGKFYFEGIAHDISGVGNNAFFGLSQNYTLTGVSNGYGLMRTAYDDFGRHMIGDATYQSTQAPLPTASSRGRIAVDMDVGKGWLRWDDEAAWIGGADDTDIAQGNLPTFTFTPGTQFWAAALSTYDGEIDKGEGEILLRPADWNYSPPNGFSQVRAQITNGGYGTNGFHLDFSNPDYLGLDVSGNAVAAIQGSAAAQWSGANGFVFNGTDIAETSGVNKAIHTAPISGDFDYQWTYAGSASQWVLFGAYLASQGGGFNMNEASAGVASMPINTGWYVDMQPSSGQIRGSGGQTFGTTPSRSTGDVFMIRRRGGTVTMWKNGVLQYTWAATSTEDVSLFVAHHDREETHLLQALSWTTLSQPSNSWLPVSLGAADVRADTPTNNYAIINPLNMQSGLALSDGNVSANGGTAVRWWRSSLAMSSGKWYFEMKTISANNSYCGIGIEPSAVTRNDGLNQYPGGSEGGVDGYGLYTLAASSDNQHIRYAHNGVYTDIADAGFNNASVMKVAVDLNAKKLWLGYGDIWIGGGDPAQGTSPTYTLSAQVSDWVMMGCAYNEVTCYFGASGFNLTPPAGFKSLCTANLPKPVIQSPTKHMDVVTYSGNADSTRSITGLGFQPDLVWIKGRSANYSHNIYDSVRGAEKALRSDGTSPENFYLGNPGDLTSFDSNGFTVRQTSNYLLNNPSDTYVAWCWKAGGAAVTNTDGTITAQVSANPAAGFSVVTYTGIGSAATVGHGLGTSPKLIITKIRNTAIEADWGVYHANLGATKFLRLNTNSGAGTSSLFWNDTAPTASVFSLGSVADTNYAAGTYVAYCWAEVPGFSKFGSYTGNGSIDGPFVYCGFRPRYILIGKTAVGAGWNWQLIDTARSPSNVCKAELNTNTSGAENTSTGELVDITASGFKPRSVNGSTNESGCTYIYAAFAEAPLGGAKTVPAKTR